MTSVLLALRVVHAVRYKRILGTYMCRGLSGVWECLRFLRLQIVSLSRRYGNGLVICPLKNLAVCTFLLSRSGSMQAIIRGVKWIKMLYSAALTVYHQRETWFFAGMSRLSSGVGWRVTSSVVVSIERGRWWITTSDDSRRLSVGYPSAVPGRTHNRNWIRSGTRNQR